MKLKWENYGDIAEALAAAYPTEDLVNIDNNRIIELVKSLPDFDDSPKPEDEELIDAVLYAWISVDSYDEERTPSWA